MSRWRKICSLPVRAVRAIGRGIGVILGSVVSVIDFRDVLLFGGAALLAYGLYEVYRPAAFIVPGALFVWVALNINAARGDA